MNADTLRRAAQASDRQRVVFLGGPFIDPEDEQKSSGSNAAKLRFFLYHRLMDEGHIVSLGEFREVVEAYKGELGEHSNAAVSEIRHAKDTADATVLIVDSPGSFAEIGAFSLSETICKKMLLIVDVAHKDSDGYVATGPFVMARSFGSEFLYADLVDQDNISGMVADFILRMSRLQNLREMVSL